MRTKQYPCYVSPGASLQAACSAGAHSGARTPPDQRRDPDEEEGEDDNDDDISMILIISMYEEEDKRPSVRSCLISILTSI